MEKSIYIIEDDVNILYGLQAKFGSEGFKTFGNKGTEKIEDIVRQIRLARPNYIVLDLILPSVDGFDLLKEIKSDDKLASAPVFIFSNLSDKDTKDKCETLGAEHYFVKADFNIDEIITKIKKIIENREKTKLK